MVLATLESQPLHEKWPRFLEAVAIVGATNALAEWVNIEPHGTVIVEGVYTTRPELRSYYDLTVFIQTSRAERLRRAIEHRANDLFWIKRWMAAEDWYLRTLKPARHVDIVLTT